MAAYLSLRYLSMISKQSRCGNLQVGKGAAQSSADYADYTDFSFSNSVQMLINLLNLCNLRMIALAPFPTCKFAKLEWGFEVEWPMT